MSYPGAATKTIADLFTSATDHVCDLKTIVMAPKAPRTIDNIVDGALLTVAALITAPFSILPREGGCVVETIPGGVVLCGEKSQFPNITKLEDMNKLTEGFMVLVRYVNQGGALPGRSKNRSSDDRRNASTSFAKKILQTFFPGLDQTNKSKVEQIVAYNLRSDEKTFTIGPVPTINIGPLITCLKLFTPTAGRAAVMDEGAKRAILSGAISKGWLSPLASEVLNLASPSKDLQPIIEEIRKKGMKPITYPELSGFVTKATVAGLSGKIRALEQSAPWKKK
jgi:hypothetical protein